MSAPAAFESVLDIRDLRLAFGTARKGLEVLHGISLHVRRGEKVALVGESGSGKSVTARLIMGLLQDARSTHVSGSIRLQGADITQGGRQTAALRGSRLTMIFQDPTSALNPVFRIGDLFHEVLLAGDRTIRRTESDARALQAFTDVAIADPARVLHSYSFQLSGGMNQRVMIAMAMANRPALLIADEPGTALDVTVQAQTLALMQTLTERNGTAVLFISHNLGVVREFADRVYVIYRGNLVEHGTTAELFRNPLHPYTRALLKAVPKIDGHCLPDTPEDDPGFGAPMQVHPSYREPGDPLSAASREVLA